MLSVGHTVLSVNGQPADGRLLKNDSGVRDILDVVNDSENYPIAIKFGRPKLSSNEKIMLAGMFHSLVHCIAHYSYKKWKQFSHLHILILLCPTQVYHSTFLWTVIFVYRYSYLFVKFKSNLVTLADIVKL